MSQPHLFILTGASRGMGLAIAEQLLSPQHALLCISRQVNDTLAEHARQAGCPLEQWPMDLEHSRETAAMLRQWLGSRPHARYASATLINNAGVVDVASRVDQMSLARLKRMFDINVIGSMLCAREAVRRMSTRHGGQGGAIVNVSSVAASLGSPNQYVDYAASKGAIDVFTLGLGREVAAEGIRVNAVRPGIIDTDIHASGGQPERAHQLSPQIPMQRPGSASEVANAIVWLLSDEASYATGSILDITGGR